MEDISDPSLSPLYQPFQMAARAVAAQHGLAANWINDVIGDALRNYGLTPQGRSGTCISSDIGTTERPVQTLAWAFTDIRTGEEP